MYPQFNTKMNIGHIFFTPPNVRRTTSGRGRVSHKSEGTSETKVPQCTAGKSEK